MRLTRDPNQSDYKEGFTLLELLVVIAIIGILASIVLVSLRRSTLSAYEAKARSETRSMQTALELYYNKNKTYPVDTNRSIMPAGLDEFIGNANFWSSGPWPGSVYDWDSWANPGSEQIYQISIRFCADTANISTCKFPNEDWAENFDQYSAVYYCVAGQCRAHQDRPIDHPGYCLNCQD